MEKMLGDNVMEVNNSPFINILNVLLCDIKSLLKSLIHTEPSSENCALM